MGVIWPASFGLCSITSRTITNACRITSSARLLVCSSARLLVCSSCRLFVCSSARLLVYSSARVLICSSYCLFVCSSARLLVRSSARPLVCSFSMHLECLAHERMVATPLGGSKKPQHSEGAAEKRSRLSKETPNVWLSGMACQAFSFLAKLSAANSQAARCHPITIPTFPLSVTRCLLVA